MYKWNSTAVLLASQLLIQGNLSRLFRFYCGDNEPAKTRNEPAKTHNEIHETEGMRIRK
jgi:hypothetical protein